VAFLMLGRNPGPTLQPDTPTLRGGQAEGIRTFETLVPQEGARVTVDSLRLGWRSEGPNARYRVTVTDDLGDVLWSDATADTVLPVPRTVPLQSGRTYFWRVDALLEGVQPSTPDSAASRSCPREVQEPGNLLLLPGGDNGRL
jgi:hypothetical protein